MSVSNSMVGFMNMITGVLFVFLVFVVLWAFISSYIITFSSTISMIVAGIICFYIYGKIFSIVSQ